MGGLAILGGLLKAVAMPLIDLFGKALAVWSAYRAGKREGEMKSDLRHATKGAETQRRMNDADSRGPRTGNDAADRMRDGTF